ncbi:hypothetical protein IKN40_01335, partial [bacterium]|nr:hypothetical protein [bacterium]
MIYLKERYKDFVSYDESLYRIINNIEIKDKCPICGKPIYFCNFKYGYMKTCNNKECIKKYKKINTSFNKKEVQEKCKQTIQEKYGVNNSYNIPEIQKKCIENL